MDKDLIEIAENFLKGKIYLEEWDCDIFSIMSDVISQHNAYKKRIKNVGPEPKFSDLSNYEIRFADLLKKDFHLLLKEHPLFEELEEKLVFGEHYTNRPNAHNISLNDGRTFIIFNTPLIHFIHSFYSKVFIVTSQYRHSDCIPDHDEIMSTDEYSDEGLISSLINDIEVFYDAKILKKGITPFHYGSPYDFCERVEGTRRFILAHELGHTLFNNADLSAAAEELALQYQLDMDVALSWALEIYCDIFGLDIIIGQGTNTPLIGPELYEKENHLIGIIQFFYTLEVIEVALNPFFEGTVKKRNLYSGLKTSHPPAVVRRNFIISHLKNNKLYQGHRVIQETFNRNKHILDRFIALMGQHSDIDPWLIYKVRGKLSEKGRIFSERLFNYALDYYSHLT